MWYPRKQNMVCRSTAEAEIYAIMNMTDITGNARGMLQDVLRMMFDMELKMPIIYSDDQLGLDAVKNGRGRTKHYDIQVKFIGQEMKLEIFKLEKISTKSNTADVFTKALQTIRLRKLIDNFMCIGQSGKFGTANQI
jgi:hypothetical protein